MIAYKADEPTTVGEAPIGLVLMRESGELVMKTEYRSSSGCECYIVSSGERYHGAGDKGVCFPVVVM